MKLKKVTIDGFRGAPRPFEFRLDGKSLCLLGENGHGKTTIADGLEYWSTGRLENFAREGCGLDASINLDHGGPATITCERQVTVGCERRVVVSAPGGPDSQKRGDVRGGPSGERAACAVVLVGAAVAQHHHLL